MSPGRANLLRHVARSDRRSRAPVRLRDFLALLAWLLICSFLYTILP